MGIFFTRVELSTSYNWLKFTIEKTNVCVEHWVYFHLPLTMYPYTTANLAKEAMSSDDRVMGHYVTRSAGRMYAGPYGGNSVSNGPTVMEITTRELQFADSTSAVRFMDHVGSKQRSRQQAGKGRRLAMAAGDSD